MSEENGIKRLRIWAIVLSILTLSGFGIIGLLMVLWAESRFRKGLISSGRGWLKGTIWLGAIQLALALLGIAIAIVVGTFSLLFCWAGQCWG